MTTESNSIPEDDIFVDKEELLREEYTNLTNEAEMISKEISDIQNELLNTEHLIDEQEIKNNEYNSYMDKKNEKRLTNAITLDDFHIYTLSELKREREEMLSMYTKKKFELQDILLQEKKLLKSFKEELASTVDIQLIRQKQEAEIERLEKEIRTTHACQSEQLKRFKEMSKIKQEQLDREIKSILDNVTEEAKKISNRLIIEHVSNICNENEELYKDILSKIDEIKFLEKEKSALQRQNEEIKRKQMYAKDLEYIEKKRCEEANKPGIIVPTSLKVNEKREVIDQLLTGLLKQL